MSYYVIPCAPIGPQELKRRTVSIGHIARSCCYVVPVALLNKELRRQYCDTLDLFQFYGDKGKNTATTIGQADKQSDIFSQGFPCVFQTKQSKDLKLT